MVSCVELWDAACSAAAPQVCPPVEMDCASTSKDGTEGWLGSHFLSSPAPSVLHPSVPLHLLQCVQPHGPDHMMSTLANLAPRQFKSRAHHPALFPLSHPCSRPRQLLPSGAIWGVAVGGSADSRGCGSPGSQIPNPLLFPDPPRARALPQHLFITPGAGWAVWFGIKQSLAGLLPATTVAHQLPYLP